MIHYYYFQTMPGYIDNAAALDSYLHVKSLKNVRAYNTAVADCSESKKSLCTPSVNESVVAPPTGANKKSERLSVFATEGQDGFFISNMHL
ncbi:hypothetical protein HDU98_001265 [Podochytrium sp. JEL0797]|nr:hypothetical protein HDU98_001265 [Podochytrium sp. JEL0797]